MTPPGDALLRARARDRRLSGEHSAIQLESPKKVLQQIRAYLMARQDDGHPGTDLYKLRPKESTDETLINLGPTIDKGATDGHFFLKSGARLSFGLTLRSETRHHSTLIAYRFDYRIEKTVYRFDLNKGIHKNPLREPRGHLHPGSDCIRVPTPSLKPSEILDILFFAIEPQ